jgi:hypothetical protein
VGGTLAASGAAGGTHPAVVGGAGMEVDMSQGYTTPNLLVYIRLLRTDLVVVVTAEYYLYHTVGSETLIPQTLVRFCDDNGSFTAIYDSPQACSYDLSDAMASLNAGALPVPSWACSR